MKSLLDFVKSNLLSLFYAVLYLIVAIVFLPERWSTYLIKKIKPSLYDSIRKPMVDLVNKIANLYINKTKTINVTEQNQEFSEKTFEIIKDNDDIEKDIYVIDLCKDLVKTLLFVTNYQPDSELLEQTVNYIENYAKLIKPLRQDENFYHNFTTKMDGLNQLGNPSFSKEVIKYCIDDIFSYLKIEREKLTNLLSNNKTQLVNYLTEEFINDKQ